MLRSQHSFRRQHATRESRRMKPPAPDDESRSIREAAFRLLAVRARTAEELRRRLAGKGFAADLAETVIADLQADGYQSDEDFARQYAQEKRTRAGWAPARVRRELRAKGVQAELAAEVVANLFAGEDLAAGILPRVLRRWQSSQGLPLETRRRRLSGYLQRRGYDWPTIKAVLTAAARADEHGVQEGSDRD